MPPHDARVRSSSLTTNPDIVVEMIATGLAVGILVDAVIVLTLLVPALCEVVAGEPEWPVLR